MNKKKENDRQTNERKHGARFAEPLQEFMSPSDALSCHRLGFCDHLRHSPVQRVLSRGVYEEEYERSLRECMAGADGFEEMLGAHQALVSQRQVEGTISLLEQEREHGHEQEHCQGSC